MSDVDKFEEMEGTISECVRRGIRPQLVLIGRDWLRELRGIRGYNKYLNDPHLLDGMMFCGVRVVATVSNSDFELII